MDRWSRTIIGAVVAAFMACSSLALAPTASAGTVGTETTAAVPVNLSHDVTAFRGSSANSNLVGWEDWLGQDTDLALDFFPGGRYTSGFTSMLNSAPAMINAWKASGRTVVWSTPILFTGQTLAQGASGTFDHYFVDLANKLVAGGAEDAVMRLGWEFNGAWFPWTIVSKPGGPTAATLAANYAAYYRRIVNAMRSVSGSAFRFDWNPNMGGAVQPDAAYPGDAYVDYVGLDVYDQSFAAAHANATTRWNFFLTRPTGLNWLRDFAATHGKQISLPEWALSENHVAGAVDDNPLFIQNMHDWINAHNVAYASYFEFDGTNPMIHRLMLGHFPQGTAKFRAIFDADLPGATWAPFATAPDLVAQQYVDVLGRQGSPERAAHWAGELQAGRQTPAGLIAYFVTCSESRSLAAPVIRLYRAYFDRVPDRAGLSYWRERLRAGASLGAVSSAFAASAEFVARFGSPSAQGFVETVYQNVLGRAPDGAGLAYWRGRLERGELTRGELMTQFSESAEYQAAMAAEVDVVIASFGMLQQVPTPEDQAAWTALRSSTGSVQAVVEALLQDARYLARFA